MNSSAITTRSGWYTEAAYLAGYEEQRAWTEPWSIGHVDCRVRIRAHISNGEITGYTVIRTKTWPVPTTNGTRKRMTAIIEIDHTLLRDARRELRRLSKRRR